MTSADHSFARSVLSEPDGTGSAARVYTLLVVVSVLVWISYLVLRHTAIPDLKGVTVFLVSTTTSLYGLNKITTAVAARSAPCHP